jgi:hypothetical protein
MDETRVTTNNAEVTDGGDVHVPASEVAGAHESDGTMGRVSGTGTGAISGGAIGAAVAGPIGAIIGAVAGGALGAAAGEAAHHIGDDHDDVNVDTGSDGNLGRISGSSAGGISGAVVGAVAGGPVGSVIGAAAGGMLGAEAGDAAKDMGDNRDAVNDPLTGDPVLDATPTHLEANNGANNTFVGSDAILPGVPGAMAGIPGGGIGPVVAVPAADTNMPNLSGRDNPDYNPGLSTETENQDTRGTMERIADAATGDRTDDNTGRIVTNDPTNRTI